jgi:hypothetical protein
MSLRYFVSFFSFGATALHKARAMLLRSAVGLPHR